MFHTVQLYNSLPIQKGLVNIKDYTEKNIRDKVKVLRVCSTEWSFLSLPPHILSATFSFHVPYSDLLGAQGQEETLLLASWSLPENSSILMFLLK